MFLPPPSLYIMNYVCYIFCIYFPLLIFYIFCICTGNGSNCSYSYILRPAASILMLGGLSIEKVWVI